MMAEKGFGQVLLDECIKMGAREVAKELRLTFVFYRIIWKEAEKQWYADVEFHDNEGRADGVFAADRNRIKVRRELSKKLGERGRAEQ